MNLTVYAIIGVAGIAVVALGWLGLRMLTSQARRGGASEQRDKAKGKALDGTLESNRIRNRVKRDPVERKRLHKKFRRD